MDGSAQGLLLGVALAVVGGLAYLVGGPILGFEGAAPAPTVPASTRPTEAPTLPPTPAARSQGGDAEPEDPAPSIEPIRSSATQFRISASNRFAVRSFTVADLEPLFREVGAIGLAHVPPSKGVVEWIERDYRFRGAVLSVAIEYEGREATIAFDEPLAMERAVAFTRKFERGMGGDGGAFVEPADGQLEGDRLRFTNHDARDRVEPTHVEAQVIFDLAPDSGAVSRITYSYGL